MIFFNPVTVITNVSLKELKRNHTDSNMYKVIMSQFYVHNITHDNIHLLYLSFRLFSSSRSRTFSASRD